MRSFLIVLFFFAILVSFTSTNTKSYPQDYFRVPVNTTLRLSGTFGELRPNHLHAGIDIKGKVGQAIFAAAEGTVARIKVQSGGYGNVLYIKHPNGYTTVYAHLKEFPAAIAEYVKQQQYQRRSFEVDLYPQAGQFTFAKGEQIGKMGVSGRSFGPHLHFEIRDSRTEKPINPLLFGLKVEDRLTPRIHQLKAYFLNDKLETLETKTFDLRKVGNKYTIYGDTLNLGAWRVGFGIKTYDHMTGVNNWNGVYAVDMRLEDQSVYHFEMETFAFSETRYINAHLDYEEQVSKKSYFNRCFRLPGNQLTIYNTKVNNGVIELSSRKSQKVSIQVSDINGNDTRLEFWVKRSEIKPPNQEIFNYFLPYDEENVVDNNSLYLYFPKGAFYNNLYLRYHASKDASSNVYSSVHHIHNYKTPVHKYFDIAIQPTNLPPELKAKAYIAYCGKDHKMQNCGGSWKNGKLTAKVRSLGDYCIMADQVPPTITPVRFQNNMKGFKTMTFKIKDDVSTTGKASDLKYKAYIDDQWILMEYDAKKDLLIHRFDGRLQAGQHQLKLIVTDDRGNEKVLERSFTI